MSTSDDTNNREIITTETAAAVEIPAAVPSNTKTIFPTDHVAPDDDSPSVFLAGSIDMGEAVDWQAEITKSLETLKLGINIFNPRRPQWDSTWRQEIDFKPFFDQVDWELSMLETVNVIAMYLPENSKAPISLLELGLFAHGGRLIVGCPKGFWRRGNVEIVCKRYKVPMVDTLEELVSAVHDRLAEIKDIREAENSKSPSADAKEDSTKPADASLPIPPPSGTKDVKENVKENGTEAIPASSQPTSPSTTASTKGNKDAKAQAKGANHDGKSTAKQRRTFSISICRNQ